MAITGGVLGSAIRRIAEAARRGNTAGDANVAVAANVGKPGSTTTVVRSTHVRTVQWDGTTQRESESNERSS